MNTQTRKVSDVPTNLHTDNFLTDFSLAYRQAATQFIAPVAATQISVLKETGKYRTFPRGYFWRDEAEVVPNGGRPVQVGYKTGEGTYACEEWGLETTVSDQERANAIDEFDLDQAAVELLDGKMLIREDRIWAQKVFQTGVWAQDYAGGTNFTAFNDAASDPIETLDLYKLTVGRGSGFRPNTIVAGAAVNAALRSNPAIVDRMKHTSSASISEQVLAAMFDVANYRVANSVYNAANETTAADGGQDVKFNVDENSLWIGYIAPRAALNTPTAVARFGWAGLTGANRLGGVISRGRDDRAKSDWIQNRNAFEIKVVAPDLGVLLTNAFDTTP